MEYHANEAERWTRVSGSDASVESTSGYNANQAMYAALNAADAADRGDVAGAKSYADQAQAFADKTKAASDQTHTEYNKVLSDAGLTNNQSAQQAAKVEADKKAADDKSCFYSFGIHLSVCLSELIAIIGSAILAVASLILWLSGWLLDKSIDYSIVGMKTNLENLNAVAATWAILRDLANISFIFILLYAAIGTILDLERVDAKKMVVRVVVAATLINFSMFFTQVVIDAANIPTVAIYNQIQQAASPEGTISAAVMKSLGIQTIFPSPSANGNGADGSLSNLDSVKGIGNLLIATILGTLFILITATVFLVAAILFIIRYVVLIFLIILSPLAFASRALADDKWFGKWWEKLVSNCIFAPFYMLMIFISLKIAQKVALSFSGGNPNYKFFDLFMGNRSSIDILIGFTVIIASMICAILVAKRLGAVGVDWATKIGGAAAFGGAAFLTRAAVKTAAGGTALVGATAVDTFKNREARGGLRNSFAMASAKNYEVGKKVVNQGVKETYALARNKVVDTKKELGKNLATGDVRNLGLGDKNLGTLIRKAGGINVDKAMTFDERKKMYKEATERYDIDKAKAQEKTDRAEKKTLEDKMRTTTLTPAETNKLAELTDKLNKITQSKNSRELEAMGFKGLLSEIRELTDRQMDMIEKMDAAKLSDAEKKQLVDARVQPVTDAVSAMPKTTDGKIDIASMSPELVEKLGKAFSQLTDKTVTNNINIQTLAQVAGYMDGGKFGALMKSDRTKQEKDRLKEARKIQLNERLGSASDTTIADDITKSSAEDLASFSEDVLTHPKVVEKYNKGILKSLLKTNMAGGKYDTIRNAITTAAAVPGAPADLIDADVWLNSPQGSLF